MLGKTQLHQLSSFTFFYLGGNEPDEAKEFSPAVISRRRGKQKDNGWKDMLCLQDSFTLAQRFIFPSSFCLAGADKFWRSSDSKGRPVSPTGKENKKEKQDDQESQLRKTYQSASDFFLPFLSAQTLR